MLNLSKAPAFKLKSEPFPIVEINKSSVLVILAILSDCIEVIIKSAFKRKSLLVALVSLNLKLSLKAYCPVVAAPKGIRAVVNPVVLLIK